MLIIGNPIIIIRFSFFLFTSITLKISDLFGIIAPICNLFCVDSERLSISTCAAIIIMLFDMNHKNQQSMFLKYAVWGNVFSTEFKREVRTRRDVSDPINRLLKFFSGMKNVKYAINHISHDGKNMVKSWFMYCRFIMRV